MVVAIWSAKEVGLNKGKRGEKKELWWKGIIERDINQSEKGYQQTEKGKMKWNWRERKEKD